MEPCPSSFYVRAFSYKLEWITHPKVTNKTNILPEAFKSELDFFRQDIHKQHISFLWELSSSFPQDSCLIILPFMFFFFTKWNCYLLLKRHLFLPWNKYGHGLNWILWFKNNKMSVYWEEFWVPLPKIRFPCTFYFETSHQWNHAHFLSLQLSS